MESAIDRGLTASPRASGLGARLGDPELSDGELLVAIGRGDRAAFEELHRRYARAILGVALTRLGDRGRAEDAAQEAFASIWRAASSYRLERGPGAPWLYAVARNAITSRWRDRSDLPVQPWDEPSPDPGPEEQALQAWRSFCVHRAFEALPRQLRPVIELAYWGGLSQSEIAERLEIPLGTVKTRTRAAMSRLSVVLKEEMQ